MSLTRWRNAGEPRRILVLGAGVIGSVCAGKLLQHGHHVVMLARDPGMLRLMVRATRQALGALRSAGLAEIPTNLIVLYLRMPETFAVRYWRRVLASPRGELWFAAHCRSARAEMTSLGDELLAVMRRTAHQVPDLDALLARR